MLIVDTFANRLQKALDRLNMKQVDLVEKTGLDKTLINKYLAGIMKAKQDKLTILANALDVNEIWLMGYDIPMDRNISLDNCSSRPSNAIDAIKVPVLGKISAGVPILAEESFEGYAVAPATYVKSGKEYFYLKVNGDSMNLKFSEGTIVLVEKTEVLENGDIGIVAINGYEATIKKYRREGNLVILEPMSTNPQHTIQIYDISKVPVHVLGKAISYQGTV